MNVVTGTNESTAAALASRLRAHHMAFTPSKPTPPISVQEATYREEEPLVTSTNSDNSNKDEVTEIFGAVMSAASDDNLAYLRHLTLNKTGEVTRDEFSIWLLYLLGRIDATDVEVVRETFGKRYTFNKLYKLFET
jgi:hypothetical protein